MALTRKKFGLRNVYVKLHFSDTCLLELNVIKPNHFCHYLQNKGFRGFLLFLFVYQLLLLDVFLTYTKKQLWQISVMYR